MTVSATPRPDEGVISWNVNTTCNYRCTYCTQRFKDDRGRWTRDTARFLAAFARLEGRWEIKISGGEPFVHPTLTEIVGGLAALRHRVSIVTNFSASEEKLAAFVRAARGRVGVFSASLHLAYVRDAGAFADKARWLEDRLVAARDGEVPAPAVCVTTVATKDAMPRLAELAGTFRARGIAFKVQPEKQEGAVVDYDDDERAELLAFGGHNDTGAVEHRLFGRPCWSGSRYFVMDDEGEVYRCYPARRAVLTLVRPRASDPERARRLGRLGSFLDPGFRLEDGPTPCLYRRCTCTVPISRKMVDVRAAD